MEASDQQSVFVRNATGLVRTLGSRDAFLTSIFSMGFMWPILYLFTAGSVYQGVDLPITVWLGLPLVLVMGYTYYLLSSTFSRSGGDYVWVSRIVHPAIGFMSNFAVATISMSFIGIIASWFVSYGLSVMAIDLNIATGNPSYLTLANTLSSTGVTLGVSIAFLLVAIAISVFGIKISYQFILATFIVLVIGLLVYFGALLSAGPAGFQAGFNKLSGTTYQAIINTANNAGYITHYTATGTLLGSVWAFLNYGGFANSVYVAGEMKRNDRAQLLGIIGAACIFAVAMFAEFGISYYVMGGPFINAASLLAGSGNPAYKLATIPIGQFLVMFANQSPIVAFLVPLGWMAATVGGAIIVFPIATRMIFAWSFDRVIPSRLSEVRGRGVPIYSVAIVSIVSLVFIIATLYTSFTSLLLYESAGLWVTIALVGIAAIIFPRVRKDLFAQASPAARRMVGGIPVVSIVGVFTLIGGCILAFASVSPAFTLIPLNAPLLGVPIVIFIVGLVIYYVSLAYHKSRGMDLKLAFKENPARIEEAVSPRADR